MLTPKRRNPAEWPEDEGAGRANVHHYCQIAMELPIGKNPEVSTRSACGCRGFTTGRLTVQNRKTSDSQLYKQAGNGVTVNVIEAIGTLLRQTDAEIRAEDEKIKR